jgi:hypothetical protein
VSVERVRKSRTYGLSSLSDRGESEYRVPFSFNLSLPARIVASYTGTWSTAQHDDPTGDIDLDGFNHQVNITGMFNPPGGLKEKMSQPIRTTLALTQSSSMNCRFRQLDVTATDQSCIPYIDFRNRTVNFTLDTFIADMTAGLQMSYTGRQDYVGIRRGSSQFQLGLFGEFNLDVGQIPTGAVPGRGGIR